jgi:hypothetical protein
MRYVTQSELKRMGHRIEKLQLQNYNAADRLGFIPPPSDLAEVLLNSELDPWQKLYMTAAPQENRIAIAASRQSGKSSVAGYFVGWCLVFIPGFSCLVASRSLRQASHFLNKVRETVLSLVPAEAMISLNRLSMELPNGSSVVSIPCAQPDAGRGFSPHLVVLDEAAFAPEALFLAIIPSVAATHGAVHMISSPNGRQGRFFNAFEGDSKDVHWSLRVTWHDCPRMTQEQMDVERVNLGEHGFRQEFLSEFITPFGAFFGATALAHLEDDAEMRDLSGLDIDDMSDLLEERMPLPDPTTNDMRAAFDRADRVRRMFYDE